MSYDKYYAMMQQANHSTKPKRFILPFPPSVNHYWKHAGKRVYLSKEAIAYREAVKNSLHGTETIKDRVSVSIVLNAPTQRKYDVDNRAKGLLDSLTHAGVWLDDEQIDELIIKRGEVLKNDGRCIVEVRAL